MKSQRNVVKQTRHILLGFLVVGVGTILFLQRLEPRHTSAAFAAVGTSDGAGSVPEVFEEICRQALDTGLPYEAAIQRWHSAEAEYPDAADRSDVLLMKVKMYLEIGDHVPQERESLLRDALQREWPPRERAYIAHGFARTLGLRPGILRRPELHDTRMEMLLAYADALRALRAADAPETRDELGERPVMNASIPPRRENIRARYEGTMSAVEYAAFRQALLAASPEVAHQLPVALPTPDENLIATLEAEQDALNGPLEAQFKAESEAIQTWMERERLLRMREDICRGIHGTLQTNTLMEIEALFEGMAMAGDLDQDTVADVVEGVDHYRRHRQARIDALREEAQRLKAVR